ncbi:LacI family DNA-binding transcriptional regulator [Paenibacillus sp. LPE1-1-1.1]|uniref:LacI family DNA-binding transcriptional regulator n=1 Tax=Paenibacillus sp. LPE1-1-1.1 TaxID=3135230 RepID=UPI00343C91CA
MTYTIKDVAKEANVSIATVSRVINDKDKVKKETREKILRAIEKLNFMPDQAARTMIHKKTKTIGMIVPQLSNEYWGTMAEIVQSVLLEKGYTLIIGTSNSEQGSEFLALNTFLERRVDGLIIGAIYKSDAENYLGVFKDQGIPLISLYPLIPNIPTVCGDNLRSSMDAVEHLIQLGHTKIAYIGSASTGLERELGYRNALMLNNIAVDEKIIVSGRNNFVHYFSEYGYECARQLISEENDFSAIFCSNDLIAIGTIKAFEEHGIDVPKDKAVVGFDDISMARLYRPALTTVKQPLEEIVDAALELLLEQIDNPDKSFTQKKITLPMKLIVRESCGSQKKT